MRRLLENIRNQLRRDCLNIDSWQMKNKKYKIAKTAKKKSKKEELDS